MSTQAWVLVGFLIWTIAGLGVGIMVGKAIKKASGEDEYQAK